MAEYKPHTPLQDAIVDVLRQHPDGTTWKEMETTLKRAPSGIGMVILKLEEKGKVHRVKIKAPDRKACKNDYWRAHKVLIKLVDE